MHDFNHKRNKKLIITSPPITFKEYLNSGIPQERIINSIVGDLQRIKLYPRRGHQVKQMIPKNVWRAFEELVQLGFNKRLIVE